MFALLFPSFRLVGFVRKARDPAARVLLTAALLVFFEALAESIAAPIYEVSLSCLVIFSLAGLALSAAYVSRQDEGLARPVDPRHP